MKISLVHPSRGRVEQALAAAREWAAKRSGAHEIEHILSVDTDDPAREAYVRMARDAGLIIVVHPNRTMIQAANAGARHATGQLLIVVSDDFGCPERWDESLAGLVSGRDEAAVQVGDGIGSRIMTLPVLTRAYYKRLGYVYFPGYRSMFADDDLTAVAARDGVLIDARHLEFPHRHYFIGASPVDATYLRQNSGESWWYGWALFEQRRVSDFGRRRGLRVRIRQRRLAAYYWVRLRGSRMRQGWNAWLPPALAGAERRLRNLILRLAARIPSVRPPE